MFRLGANFDFENGFLTHTLGDEGVKVFIIISIPVKFLFYEKAPSLWDII